MQSPHDVTKLSVPYFSMGGQVGPHQILTLMVLEFANLKGGPKDFFRTSELGVGKMLYFLESWGINFVIKGIDCRKYVAGKV